MEEKFIFKFRAEFQPCGSTLSASNITQGLVFADSYGAAASDIAAMFAENLVSILELTPVEEGNILLINNENCYKNIY